MLFAITLPCAQYMYVNASRWLWIIYLTISKMPLFLLRYFLHTYYLFLASISLLCVYFFDSTIFFCVLFQRFFAQILSFCLKLNSIKLITHLSLTLVLFEILSWTKKSALNIHSKTVVSSAFLLNQQMLDFLWKKTINKCVCASRLER